MLASVDAAPTRMSSTRSCAICSWSLSRSGASATDRLRRPHLLRVDLLPGPAFVDARDLALGGVVLGDREIRRGADLLRDGRNPFDEVLESRPCRDRLPPVEVEQVAREAPADRTPHVLLEQPVRQVRQRLALVVRPQAARRERVTQ